MDTARMDGTTAAISGGSSGVGLAIAKGLAGLGARTIVLSRSEPNGRKAVAEIRAAHPAADVSFVTGTLGDSASARQLADRLSDQIERLDVLVSSAGSVGESGSNAAGVPNAFATNYLTHYLLLRSLLPALEAAPGSRALIVGVAPALVKRLKKVRLDGIDKAASQTTSISQATAWKLLLAAQPLPLRLVGTVMNRFAATRCAVAEYLASSPAAASIKAQMIDNHGRPVPLPSLVTSANAAAVWEASAALTA